MRSSYKVKVKSLSLGKHSFQPSPGLSELLSDPKVWSSNQKKKNDIKAYEVEHKFENNQLVTFLSYKKGPLQNS